MSKKRITPLWNNYEGFLYVCARRFVEVYLRLSRDALLSGAITEKTVIPKMIFLKSSTSRKNPLNGTKSLWLECGGAYGDDLVLIYQKRIQGSGYRRYIWKSVYDKEKNQ